MECIRPPDLSLRGRFAPVAISGRHLQFVQSADKTYKPIASVAAVSDRLAGWQCLQRKFIGAMPSSLSLRGGRRPTWQSRSTRPDHRKAIGENATAFPRLPRRFAPRNDTSGSAVVYQRPPTVELPCTGRSLSAATVKFDSDCVRRHSVYIGSAFPRLPRPLRGLAMTIRECMPFSRWPVSCAGAAPGGTCPSPTIITIITMFNVYLEESQWRI